MAASSKDTLNQKLHHLRGHFVDTSNEQSAEARNYIASTVDLAKAFEFGLIAVIDGPHKRLVAR
jgi:hypothetical protein